MVFWKLCIIAHITSYSLVQTYFFLSFLALALRLRSFFRLSRFFKPSPIPPLHTSTYFSKKPSRSPASTTVAILVFSSLFLDDLPFVARKSVACGDVSDLCNDMLGKIDVKLESADSAAEGSCSSDEESP